MTYSYNKYVGDGSTTQYAINFVLGFLSRDDVFVFVDGVDTAFTWISDGLIDISVVPLNGSDVLIRRIVDKSTLIHDYNDGAVVMEANLDDSNMQHIMGLHEVLDGFIELQLAEELDMHGKRIINVGYPVEGTDAATMGYVDQFSRLGAGGVESVVLTTGQLDATFTYPLTVASFNIYGAGVDAKRLIEGIDYSKNVVAGTITLTYSYPEGTHLTMSYFEPAISSTSAGTVAVDTAGFDNNLTAADTDVQHALQSINDLALMYIGATATNSDRLGGLLPSSYLKSGDTASNSILLDGVGVADFQRVDLPAAVAVKLQTPRTISIEGDVEGTADIGFDGTSDVVITVSCVNCGSGGGGGSTYLLRDATFDALAGGHYLVDSATTAVSVVLPLAPAKGDTVNLKMCIVENITIIRSGEHIEGVDEDMVVDSSSNHVAFSLNYFGSTKGWVIL